MTSARHTRFLSLRSLPLKICLAILLIQGLFLFLLGKEFLAAYTVELERTIQDKLTQPGVLMSQQSMHFVRAREKAVLSRTINEEVVECLVINPNGTVLFSDDPDKNGEFYQAFLHQREQDLPFTASGKFTVVRYTDASGNLYFSSLAPLTIEELFFGNLFLRIKANHVAEKERNMLLLFLLASGATLAFTITMVALFIYQLLVPRIDSTLTALDRIQQDQVFEFHKIPSGPPDQVGLFIRRVNEILLAVTQSNQDLRRLHLVGEQLATAADRRTLYSVATETTCRFFSVQQGELDQLIEGELDTRYYHHPEIGTLTRSDDRKTLFLSLPSPEKQNEFVWVKFFRSDEAAIEKADQTLYFDYLSRIFKSAIRRIRAFEEIAQAEERYRELFSSAVEGIFRISATGRLEVVNPALSGMSGYQSPEEMMRSITDISTQYYAEPDGRRNIFTTLLEEGKIVDHETFFRRKDGSIFPAAISCHIVKNSQGGIIAYEGRIVNIEERKLREEEEQNRKAAEAVSRVQLQMVAKLEKNEQQLQQSLQEKEVLLREIYHRTKNNMLVIISMLKLQLGDISDPITHSIFQETENRIRAMAMVHEKLYQSDNLVDIDLATYLTDLVSALVKSMVVNQQIRINTDTQPVPISIDNAVPLGLAVNEIVTNSLKHGFPENRSGSITLSLCQSPTNVIELRVKDTGVGLPKDFTMENNSSFGLQITKNLVCKQLGGTLTMVPNGGSETIITFKEPERVARIL